MEPKIDSVGIAEPTDETDGTVEFHLTDGRIVIIPLDWSWRLQGASQEERQNYEIHPSGKGVHWPDVDEDLSVKGALEGAPAPRPTAGPTEVDEEHVRREAWPPARIKRLRKELGETQEEFANRLGVRQGTVSDWENGKHIPRRMAVRFLDQIASSHSREEKITIFTGGASELRTVPPPSPANLDQLALEAEFPIHSNPEAEDSK